MAAPKFKKGDHVEADFGHGLIVAHYVSGPHQNDEGETKHTVQAADGSQRALAYRETADYDSGGSGLTFQKL